MAVSYMRVTGPVLRGPAGVVIAVASFAAGAALRPGTGGRGARRVPGPAVGVSGA